MRLIDKDKLIDEVKKMWLSSENDKYKVLEYIEKSEEISMRHLMEVKVGDEVYVPKTGQKHVVISIDVENKLYVLYPQLGWVTKDYFTKTGKHYPQIDEVLRELKK